MPLRYSEFGAVYRNEHSGALHGLTRVRGLTMDDAHLFVRPDQLEVEVASTLELVLSMLRDFGLTDFYLELLHARRRQGQVARRRRDVADHDRGTAPCRGRVRSRARRRPRRGRVLRPQDLGAGP
ncbi:MAG: aminoacyl--tRNA ligase-related protein [Microcella pacifica]